MRESSGRNRQPPLSERDAALTGARLYLSAQAIAGSLLPGRHSSSSRGISTEFYDFRAYAPGDPARLLDWRALARTDRAYVRNFQDESQLCITVVLDATASMEFAGLDSSRSRKPLPCSKFWRAKELAAAIALVAVRQSDRIGLAIAGAAPDCQRSLVFPPGSGRESLRGVLGALEEATPGGSQSEGSAPLRFALESAERLLPRGGLLVVLTDALDEPGPLLESLARLRFAPGRRREVALIQILTSDEMDLSRAGRAMLTDPESGRSVGFEEDSSSQAYRTAIARQIDTVRSGVLAMHGRYALSLTHRPAAEALYEAFARSA